MIYDGIIEKPSMDDIIEHHGIKGQRWGVRNGPPYPLDKSTSSRVKKSAGLTSKKSSSKNRDFRGLSDDQIVSLLQLSVFTLITVGPIAAYVAERKIKQIQKREAYTKMSELRTNEKVDKKTGLLLKSDKNATPEEDLELVNSLRGSKDKESWNTFSNCTYCTTAYDLRRRGYDVVAGTTPIGVDTKDIESWYKDGKFKKIKREPSGKALMKNMFLSTSTKDQIDSVKKAMVKNEPVGSRGNICVYWLGSSSGHSMAYEITEKGLVIRDGQSNQSYYDVPGGKNSIYNIFKHANMWDVQYMRTDNLTPNYEKLKKDGIIR